MILDNLRRRAAVEEEIMGLVSDGGLVQCRSTAARIVVSGVGGRWSGGCKNQTPQVKHCNVEHNNSERHHSHLWL